MLVEFSSQPGFKNLRRVRGPVASAATDYTAVVKLTRLRPGTRYFYRVSFGGPKVEGTFRTAPPRSLRRFVRFLYSGDISGSGYCRTAAYGYPIFFYMAQLRPDFVFMLGDQIYADGRCTANGPDGPGGVQYVPADFPSVADRSVDWRDRGAVREIYFQHWRYNRTDRHLQYLLGLAPAYFQWDDHEIINNSGASWTYWKAENPPRPGYPNLAASGREAFFAYSPIDRTKALPNRTYRSVRWGKELEVFVLDTRSYRSRNDAPDGPSKTLLGRAQLDWLKRSVTASRATWKVVASGVPIGLPTGDGGARDAWANGGEATGFERELLNLLGHLDRKRVENVVFIATDVHFAQHIRYQKDFDGDRRPLTFHELISGPLSAGPSAPQPLDSTAGPVPLYGEGGFFNFGYVRIVLGGDQKFHFVAEIRDGAGETRQGSQLDLTPR